MASQPQATKTTQSSQTQSPRPTQSRGRKVSDYGRQLAEKQKARREYGLHEAQFRRYFAKASRSSLATGQALFTELELRLDNILYRTGIAKTRRMGRQMVNHGLVLVNSKRMTMPSYSVKAEDEITLKKYENFEYNKEVIIPDWLTYDSKKHTVRVQRLPKSDDLITDINPQLIIEFYSR